jgi:8-amino-7-oxononanoate synthase
MPRNQKSQMLRRLQDNWSVKILRALELEGKAPYFRAMQTANSPRIEMDGRPRMMLGSSNYLGLADHPLVIEGARLALERFGAGSTGSRLLNGTIDLHLELEAEIADWYGTEAAIVCTTGHQANLATVGTLAGRGDVIVSDADAHASLHDAAKFTDAQSVRFRHNDIDNLAEKLAAAAKRGRPALVTVDGVYSMEGDLAPIDQIAEACCEHDALLLVDEAHSVGVFGPNLTGVTELYGKAGTTPLRTGTFSKSIASSTRSGRTGERSCSPRQGCPPPSAGHLPRSDSSGPPRARNGPNDAWRTPDSCVTPCLHWGFPWPTRRSDLMVPRR